MSVSELRGFFIESSKIVENAQFVIESLPQAEEHAVEGTIHCPDAARTILLNLNDNQTSAEEL